MLSVIGDPSFIIFHLPFSIYHLSLKAGEDMTTEFHPPQRILLGPGPSNVEARVVQAMMKPILGYLDPVYLECLDEIQRFLRQVFETGNRVTLSMSGTGGCGMEACVANLVEEGEEALVCVNGFFGQRMAEKTVDANQRLLALFHEI